jgi:hypothetical protein
MEQKLKQSVTTKPPLQKILKRILHTQDKNKSNYEGTGNINLMRRADKDSESSSELPVYTQILKQ